MNRIYIVLVFLIFFSCKENIDLDEIENLNGNKISVIGHAGMGIASQFPINSFESFSNAIALGADGIEIDIQMTKDSVLVAFHDKNFEESSTLNGLVSELSWEQIEGGTYKVPLYVNYKIISLNQLLENLPYEDNVTFFLDCKLFERDRGDNHVKTYVDAVLKSIDTYEVSNNVIVEFRDVAYLEKLKDLRPEIKSIIYTDFEYGLAIANALDLYGVIANNDDVSVEQISEAHDSGRRVTLFGLHTAKENSNAVKKNPDFLQTDKVNNLVKLLK